MKKEEQEQQKKLEQAIENVNKLISAFQCDGPTRYIIDANWQLVVCHARANLPTDDL